MTEIVVALIGAVSIILQTIILKYQHSSEQKRKDDRERMEIILECQEACLLGVRVLGANGRVKDGLKKLEDYKNKKAAM